MCIYYVYIYIYMYDCIYYIYKYIYVYVLYLLFDHLAVCITVMTSAVVCSIAFHT